MDAVSAHQLELEDLDRLLALLADDGYTCIGPTLRDSAIVYDVIASSADLPRGWTDEQAPGHYRLRRRADQALFGYNVGPQAWKRQLFPPRERVWQMSRDGEAFVPTPTLETSAVNHAFIGVRACELAAIGVQDRVFGGGDYRDDAYLARRAGAFIVAVNCVEAGGTCFCADLDSGPAVADGHDLALTEVVGDNTHRFLAVAGSARGAALLARLACAPATADLERQAAAGIERAHASMGRRLDRTDLPALLARSLDSPHWETLATRCLACANCTAVCPTCFCSSFEDSADLDGAVATRWRQWDSCFNPGFSYLHGGEVRRGTAARYRQWLTHKLGTWHAQFGSSGCVGCGRCITWCPVGIDLTAEVARLRVLEAASGTHAAAAGTP